MPRTGLAVGATRSVQDRFSGLLRAAFPEMQIAVADSLRTARPMIAAMRPEFIVMEPELRDGSGAELLHWSRRAMPESRAAVVGSLCNLPGMLGALRSGARGYLLMEEPAEVLIRQMHSVARGELSCAPLVAEMVGLSAQPRSRAVTEQQHRILMLVAEGLTSKQIAARLDVSVNTVETHRKRLYSKLSVKSRVQATRLAMQSGVATD